MSTADNNLSAYNKDEIPDASDFRVGIVVSEWNNQITNNLLKGATNTLLDCGVSSNHILVSRVPGSFELPLGAQMLLESQSIDAIICLGCVIQGETAHFTFICETCAAGIKDVMLKYNKPVMFGVLTDNRIEQSIARSGGKLGNKGTEAAITAIKMIALQKSL